MKNTVRSMALVMVISVILMVTTGSVFATSITLPPVQTQNQGQAQGQIQGQIQGQGQGQGQSQNTDVTVRSLNTAPIDTPQVGPSTAPLASYGFGNYPLVPMFANPLLTPFDFKKDKVVRVVKVFDGGVFTSIRMKEFEEEMLKAADEVAEKVKGQEDKVRVMVQYQGSGWGINNSAGAAGSESYHGGLAGATGGIFPAIGSSTTSPKILIKIVIVQ